MKFLFIANGEQRKTSGEDSLQHCSKVVKRSAFLSLLLPCFLGPLTAVGSPSPWTTERCAHLSEGWVVRGNWR